MSADIKEKLQLQLDQLESELRVHLPKEIKRALEFGDLRENSEYRAALDRQNVVKARIVELRQRISEISSIDIPGSRATRLVMVQRWFYMRREGRRSNLPPGYA